MLRNAKKPLKMPILRDFQGLYAPLVLGNYIPMRLLLTSPPPFRLGSLSNAAQLPTTVHLRPADLIHLVSSHLFCYFFSKVLFFLFDTFACLKTNKCLDCNLSSISFRNFFHVFSNRLFSVFCFYVYLV